MRRQRHPHIYFRKKVGDDVPTYKFNPTLATFTAKMAKRTAPGPFAAAPIVQGDWNKNNPDILSYGGTQIHERFYSNVDTYQGAVVFWITPEWDGDDYKDHYIYDIDGSFTIYKSGWDNNLTFRHLPSGALANISISTWTAGTTYFIVIRWDRDNPITATNYTCISVNDVHYFEHSTPYIFDEPGTQYIGSNTGTADAGNAIIEGLTVYRRVLYDGTYGVDAGNGDEINKMWVAGAGKKPEEVTGGDDICFQLHTNGSTGEIVTGIGEAWSFPCGDNELLNWHMQDDDDTPGAPDDWTNYGSATLANAETANKLFCTRSQKVSVDAVDEGIYQSFTVSAGEDYYINTWVKDAGASKRIKIIIWDNTGAATIAIINSSGVGEWEQLGTCFEAPTGCNSIGVNIRSLDNDTYSFYIGQVQVLPNLVDNGGMEGTYDDEGGGYLLVAPGWNNKNCETDGNDLLSKETTIKHSGGASQKIVVNAGNEGIETAANVFNAGNWYLLTIWLYGISGSIKIKDSVSDFAFYATPGASWTKYSYVVRVTGGRTLSIQSSAVGASFYVDDVSVIELDDVSLTITPASKIKSAEASGLRVDGRDICTEDITGILGATSGKIKFKWTPRHGDGDFEKFGNDNPNIIKIYKDDSNYIVLYMDTNDSITLNMNCGGGGAQSNAWDASGIAAATTYPVEIEYNDTQVTAKFGGVIRNTIIYPGGIDFGVNIPDTAYIGQGQLNTQQSDAAFKQP